MKINCLLICLIIFMFPLAGQANSLWEQWLPQTQQKESASPDSDCSFSWAENKLTAVEAKLVEIADCPLIKLDKKINELFSQKGNPQFFRDNRIKRDAIIEYMVAEKQKDELILQVMSSLYEDWIKEAKKLPEQ